MWQRAICLCTRTLAPWQSTDNDDNDDDDVDDVDDDDNDDAKNFRRRENFRKTRSGRRDRFRQKIVKIGVILAIFEPFENLRQKFSPDGARRKNVKNK